jgi:exodeoxyribonuclease-5
VSDFQLTPGQAQALEMVKRLVKEPHDRPRVGVMRGVAGVGKTTLLKVFGHEVGGMAIIAPTGKAAVRVTEATGLPASTIHRYIYAPHEDPFTGEVTFRRKPRDEVKRPESGLIVVEESSMLNAETWQDIYDVAVDNECHVLCVGDPFQLPPVEVQDGAEPFGVLLPNFKFDMDTTLTEVTRQALESPIIRASMALRAGKIVDAVMDLPRVLGAQLLEHHVDTLAKDGVVICHRNKSRHELNRRIREHLKRPEKTLDDGEPLLVLRNNYQLMRFNGEVMRFDSWVKRPGNQREIYDPHKKTQDQAAFGLGLVEGEKAVLVPKAINGKLDHMGYGAMQAVAEDLFGSEYSYLHCGFGYTLTAHKSQGSEWKHVLVVVERSVQPYTKDGQRWLYTAVTRAREHVSLVWLAGWNDAQIT